MGKRLTGFDYSRPMFYMVTIKCRKGVQALCEIVAPGKCQMNAITRAMVNCIRNFHLGCEQIARIECFSIMPDHIHLLIRIVDRSKAIEDGGADTAVSTSHKSNAPIRLLRLETIVDLLMQALEGRYREVTGLREPAFEASWHDWIVIAEGQLAAFTCYIRENPRRAFLREENRRYFTGVRRVNFAGCEDFGQLFRVHSKEKDVSGCVRCSKLADRMYENRGVTFDSNEIDVRFTLRKREQKLPFPHSDFDPDRMVVAKEGEPAAAQRRKPGFIDDVWTVCQFLSCGGDVP